MPKRTPEQPTGISNRESAQEETAERAQHPPVDTGSPLPASRKVPGAFGKEPDEGSQKTEAE